MALLCLFPDSSWSEGSAEDKPQAARLEAATRLFLEAKYDEAYLALEALHDEGLDEASYLLAHFHRIELAGYFYPNRSEESLRELYENGMAKAASGLLTLRRASPMFAPIYLTGDRLPDTLAWAEAAAELATYYPNILTIAGLATKVRDKKMSAKALDYFLRAARLGDRMASDWLAIHCSKEGSVPGFESCRQVYELAARRG
ncbi:MAG: hypothetical protein R3245_04945, partial [Kiloniellales bacterium]|nr:hypothetical protein [Kiloniellales bacterium]